MISGLWVIDIKNNRIYLTAAVILCAAVFLFLLLREPSFHFQKALGFQLLDGGNILVTDGGGYKWGNSGSKVFIINRKGRILWLYEGVAFAHSAIKLKNNNILIPDTNNDRIIEVDRDKNIVWSSESWGNGTGTLSDGTRIDYPNFVQELDNGRFLISSRFTDTVFEADRSGKVYWSYNKVKKQHSPRRLKNGNTLISDSDGNRVIEVNPEGKIVWYYDKGLSWPRHVFPAAENAVLIVDSNRDRVIKVNRKGEILFEFGHGILAKPYQAEETADGNIMIADAQHGKLLEVSPAGKVVWKYERSNRLGTFLKMPFYLKNGGAEIAGRDGLPKDWVKCDLVAPDGGVWSRDVQVKYSGEASFKIEGDGNEASNRFWAQYIKCLWGRRLIFKCRIKTQGVRFGAGASINFADKKGGLIGGVNSRTFRGDNDWTEININTSIPKGAAIAAVVLMNVGPGTAWWDDAEIVRTK